MRTFYCFIASILGVALLMISPVWATQISVSGDVSGVWSADTVLVTGEVRVPPGQSLTILPGVEVLFQVYCKLIVDNGATLQAVGTPANSIRFDVLPPNLHWNGVRFLSASDSSRLEYCSLTHGQANVPDNYGGAIYCSSSSPTISNNTISGNNAYVGGGISCENSNPVISGNTISGNGAQYGGGIFCGNNSNAMIIGNTISGNSVAAGGGGGIGCGLSSPSIIGNTISGNWAQYGAGILCGPSSNPSIIGNSIRGNSAQEGGGIASSLGSPSISENLIIGNTASYGGGIWLDGYSNISITGNTISENTSFGIYFSFASATLVNCIVWGNNPAPFFTTSSILQATYCDIQGGLPGTGIINADPLFVNTTQHDFRLQWGSPCIDSGDPNPIYNDPDLTRADMGAFYYDQSMPVRVLLTPYNQPIQIPAAGGSFNFGIQATNIGGATLPALVWCDVTLPLGTIYGPVLGPVTISLASGQTLSRLRTQAVPAGAPPGIYHYNAYAAAAGDTSEDSFTFSKLGAGGLGLGAGKWDNTGEEFEAGASASGSGLEGGLDSAIPTIKSLITSCNPNPFNPITAISYQLPADSYVSLRIYDTAGRLVATVVNGWRAAGTYEAVFDGSNLASGIYIHRLEAGNFSAVKKLILLK